jgi:uncharacterized membrane protein
MMQAATGAGMARTGASEVFLWSIILIIGLIGLFLIVVGLKRWLWSTESPSRDAGFTLSDLRDLHRRGELSDEEFERMHGQVVEAARRSAAASEPSGDKPQTELKQPPG